MVRKIILSSDVKYKMITTHAWKDLSTIHLFDLIDQYMEQGLQYLPVPISVKMAS